MSDQIIKYGSVRFLINEMIETRGISKNKLCDITKIQRLRLNAYCNNKVQRPDIDTLSRLCYALDCELSDLMVYIKPDA